MYNSLSILSASPDPHCHTLLSPSIPSFVLSLLILLGILISYLPQHHRIITRKTSRGLSPYFVLLGATGCTCQIANIFTLPASRADVACCRTIGAFPCAAAVLGVAQVSMQFLCFFVILVLFLVYYPRQPEELEEGESWQVAKTVGYVVGVHALITAVVSVVVAVWMPERLQGWANVLGLLSTALACVQYLPQIWTTAKLGRVESLSIPMMCVQTPGSFVWAASLAGRVGWEGWSAWGVYLVTGCLQGVLLVMAVVFESKRKSDETTPLLGEQQ